MDTNLSEPSGLTSNVSVPGTAPRLPCRGCLKGCPNYDLCDGKPWRLGDGDTANPDQ